MPTVCLYNLDLAWSDDGSHDGSSLNNSVSAASKLTEQQPLLLSCYSRCCSAATTAVASAVK